MWRSPVAYTAGGRVVAGSNPVIPTELKGAVWSSVPIMPPPPIRNWLRCWWLRFLVMVQGYAWSSVRIIPTTPKRNCLRYRWLRFFVLELGVRVVVRTDHPDRVEGGRVVV